MKNTTRMVLAIIALVFMLAFTVMLTIGVYNSQIMNGAIFYVAMAAGIVAIAIYVILMRDTRIKNEYEAMKEAEQNNLQNDEVNSSSNSQEQNDTNSDQPTINQ